MIADSKPRHVCSPRIREYGSTSPPCMDCGAQLVRLIHFPGHVVAGSVCTYPDSWKHCFLPLAVDNAARADLLRVPEWRRG